MAQRKQHAGSADLRAYLAESWRSFAEDFAERIGMPAESVGGYLQRAEALEAGEPVEVAAWELPAGTVPRGDGRRYVIQSDGELLPDRRPGATS